MSIINTGSDTFQANTIFLQPSWFCDKQCPGCFSAGTLISTSKGQVPIEQIQSGDQVYAYDNSLGQLVLAQVQNTTRHQSNEVFEIQVGESILHVTGEHPLLTRRGWVEVKDLTEDDEVLCDVDRIK